MGRRFLPRRRPGAPFATLPLVVGAIGAAILLTASCSGVLTAANVVEPGRLSDQSHSVTAQDLRPPECVSAGTSVVAILSGGATLTGTNDPTLLLGDAATTTIAGGAGNDCIVGGTATSAIDGGGGNDTCVGPVGVLFTNCEQTATR